jgi:hypothetical protein
MQVTIIKTFFSIFVPTSIVRHESLDDGHAMNLSTAFHSHSYSMDNT